MQLLLDSVDPKDIEEVAGWGLISGVTTNPGLYAARKGDFVQTLRDVLAVSPGDVFAQVLGWHDRDPLIRQALWLAEQSERIVVKLPMSIEGLQALIQLKKDHPHIRIAITTVSSVSQALLCAKAGADVVALFNGAFDTVSDTPIEMVTPVKRIYTHYGYKTRILSCGRFPRGVGEFAAAGSDYCTMKKEFHKMLYEHPYTDKRMLGFLADWEGAFGDKTWPEKD
jgi:transaldolase